MDDVLKYVSSYFTTWSATTAEHVSTITFKFAPVILLSSTWLVTMVFGKNKTVKHCATISKACLGKKQEQHNNKWEEQFTYYKAQTLTVT